MRETVSLPKIVCIYNIINVWTPIGSGSGLFRVLCLMCFLLLSCVFVSFLVLSPPLCPSSCSFSPVSHLL